MRWSITEIVYFHILTFDMSPNWPVYSACIYMILHNGLLLRDGVIG